MVKINLNLVPKTLKAINVAKQDRNAASGNLTGMRQPPTILSQEWRPTPSSRLQPEPEMCSEVYAFAYTPLITARAGRLAASRFGFLARREQSSLANLLTLSVPSYSASHGSRGTTAGIGRVGSKARICHRIPVDHDYQSHDQRDAQFSTFPGQQPGSGTTQTLIRGK